MAGLEEKNVKKPTTKISLNDDDLEFISGGHSDTEENTDKTKKEDTNWDYDTLQDLASKYKKAKSNYNTIKKLLGTLGL